MMEVVIEGSKTVLVEKIKRVRGKDKEVVRIIEEMNKVVVKVLRDEE